MDIGQIASQAQAASSNQAQQGSGSGKMGQQEFLKLLITQMQNQDPMNPMKGKEMASQLAQFNSVEQLIGVNEGLATLQKSQEKMRVEMTNSMAASLTGKKVRALSNKVKLEAGKSTDISYELSNAADEVKITVKDSSGSVVRSETLNGAEAGQNSWTWDGKTSDGTSVAEGKYSVEINATSGDETVKSRMFTEGTAQQVRYTGNGVRINIDGIEVPIGNIETVGTKSS